MKVGITGNTGFTGTHLTNYLQKKGLKIVPFEKEYFLYQDKMNDFVKQSDVVIHLAGRSKPHNDIVVYNDNVNLTSILYKSIIGTGFNRHLIFASSIHEGNNTHYGNSKYTSRFLLSNTGTLPYWSKGKYYKFTGLILPNVFGEGARIKNSFITNFCWQLFKGEEPKIFKDVEISLIYIGELARKIYDIIIKKVDSNYLRIPATSNNKLSYILSTLKMFESGEDMIKGKFEINLNKTWKRNLATWR